MRRIILDLFAGPGCWSHALTVPRARDIGLEWDSWACRTRARVVQLTIQTDVARDTVWVFSGRIPGLTASPPRQAWSMAGKRLGRVDQPLVRQAASLVTAGLDQQVITRGVRDGSAGARRRGSSTRPGSAGGATGAGGATRGRSGVARASMLFGSGPGRSGAGRAASGRRDEYGPACEHIGGSSDFVALRLLGREVSGSAEGRLGRVGRRRP